MRTKGRTLRGRFVDKTINVPKGLIKFLAIMCMVALLCTSIPLVSLSVVGAQVPIYAKTTDYLNLRTGAGTQYGVVTVIDDNTTVSVTERTNSNWVKVKLSNGKTGYCSGDYIEITTDAKTTDYVNLRTGAGTNYSVKQTLNPGVVLDIRMFCNKSWAKVRLSNGTTGYVCTDYVNYVNNGSTGNDFVKVSISKTSATLNVGKTVTLTATTNSGGKFTWSSSNTKIATVTSGGVVKGVSAGTATITAKDSKSGKTVKCTVKVSGVVLTAIKLPESSKSLTTGGSYTIKPTITPSNGKVSYSTSNKSVATVSSSGVVKAVKAGTAKITVADVNGSKKAVLTVNVSDKLTISKTSVTLDIGNTAALTATTSSGGKFTWSSSDKKIATVDSKGVVKAVAAGSATITAKDGKSGKTVKCTVKVNKPAVLTAIKLSESSKSLTVGSSHTIKPTITPSNGKVSYSTSNKSVATVTSGGVVKAVKAGTAKITVADVNGGKKAVLTVNVSDKLTISKTSATINIGGVVALSATTTSGGEFTWSSSNKNVATVSSKGTVRGVSEGSAAITAKDSKLGKTVKCTVKVNKLVVLTAIKLSESSKSLTVGSSYTIKPTITPSNGKVSYSTSNKSVATVSSSGVVKAVKAGTAKITVADVNGSKKAVVTVKVEDKLTVSRAWVILDVGRTVSVKATTTSGGKFTWSSSNKNVATVTSDGKIKGIAPGSATVTAKDGKSGKTVKCSVTVNEVVLTSIKLPESSKSLTVGSSYTIKPTITPSNGKVSYSTSNKTVATVTSAGVVKAVKAGTANIKVYDPNGSKSATLKVTVQSLPTITISKSSANINLGANITLKAALSNNGSVKWSTSNSNVAAVRNGVVSGLKSGTANITASDSTGKVKATCKITVKSVSSSGMSLSRYSASTTAGKTIYIKGYSNCGAYWGTSNSNIATVRDGFIQTKNPGKVAITYTNSNGSRVVCVVTVNNADPIKFTYSSPNSAVRNSNVKLIAITDKTRTAVKFVITVNGKNVTVNANEKKSDGNTYVWTATYKATVAGTLKYKAYSYKDSKWSTSSDGEADIYVTTKTDKKKTTTDKLRASDEVIKFIGEKEGYVSQITYDTLANNIPTLGYGYVVWEGWSFYDNLTKNEAYALLVSAVNQEVYARRVNEMLVANKIKFNQQQFDALVSFSYNLGTGWTYSSDLLDILCNSYGPSTSSGTATATVDADGGLYLRKSYTTSSDIITLMPDGSTVTLVSTNVYNGVWYKVKTSSGKVGYCSGTYLNLHYSGSNARDLNYVNKNALIKEMLAYHHAGGVCYYGLLYRRADELEMFLYGDYAADGRNNKHNFPSPYCISW